MTAFLSAGLAALMVCGMNCRVVAANSVEFYVAPSGDDANAGTAERLRQATRFATQAIPGSGGALFGKGWRGGWAIPFSALGLSPTPGLTVAFNMSAFCSEFGEWHCWEGTQAESWRLDQAGGLSLK